MRKLTALILSVALLAACQQPGPRAYFDRGSPEQLLDVSSEVVNLNITSERSLDELNEWVNTDQPTRAELYCMDEDMRCAAARDTLDLYGVPTFTVPSHETMVTLVYERVLARDCENRYIDNSNNPYNLPHPTYGCSLAANMVQMVSNKQQFVSPNLLDLPDAKKASQIFQRYQDPPTAEELAPSESAIEGLGLSE